MAGPAPMRRARLSIGLIAALFALSVLLRLGGLGAAFASGDGDAPGVALATATECLDPGIVETALVRVRTRDAALDRRAAALADRAQAVALGEELLANRLAELEAAESRLSELLARSSGAAEADLARLTRVYETMEPAAAAPLFEAMDPGFAIGFLARMSPESAARIMALLPADRAYTLSVLLAGRNLGAPVPDDAVPTAPEAPLDE